jgi:spore maturation protein CgeB
MKILCVFGEHNYGDPSRGQGYEYSNFLPAFRRLGHEVVFFESFDRSRYRDFPDLNRQLLEAVEREDPDVVFCVLMGYEVWLETIALAQRACRARWINWATDDSWKYAEFSRFVAPGFDLYVTTSASALRRAEAAGLHNVALSQWAANAECYAAPLPAGECRYPVSFVGSAYGNRPKWIAGLKARGIAVSCFGHGWEGGPVAAGEIPRIIRASVISLNFGDSGVVWNGLLPHRSRQIKARIFEVPGAGGFLLTEPAERLDEYYKPGEEMELFHNLEELVQKIEHYLAHPEQRDRIAHAGHARTVAAHSYDMRFAQLLALAVAQQPACASPPPCAVGPNEFAGIAARHRPTPLLRLLRWLLVTPCVLLWGHRRGRRAARRILFELSWRLLGRHTYTAGGWPGRLFYAES